MKTNARRMLALLMIVLLSVPAVSHAQRLVMLDLQTATYDEIVEALELLSAAKTERLMQQYRPQDHVQPESAINFRGFPWLCTKATVEQTMGKADSYQKGWAMHPDNYVNTDGFGLKAKFYDLEVAGYTAAYTDISYMYPVCDGEILSNEEDALFYMAEYTFRSLGDGGAVAEDLTAKLVQLYGKYTENRSGRRSWTDENGNVILLRAYDTEVYLVYHSVLADSMYQERKQIINAQRAAQEEEERIKNQSNFNGL